jgi:hypothetical protein
MLTEKQKVSGFPRIGEIFIQAGILKPQVITDCLSIAKRSQMQVGRFLVMSGHVSLTDIECAVYVQEQLRVGRISREAGLRLVRRVHCTKMSVAHAEELELYERAFSLPFSQLGQLLYGAQIFNEDFLSAATFRSSQQRMPLGRLLVEEGKISKDLLVAALNCLIHVRDKKITRILAAQVLNAAYKRGETDLTSALRIHGLDHLIESDPPRLLRLFSSASLLSDSDASMVVELGLETGKQAGQVLVSYGFVDENLLDSALQLQQMIYSRTIKFRRATELLNLCFELRLPLEALLARVDNLNQVAAFLRRGGLLDESKIRDIAAKTTDFDCDAGITLCREGVISKEMMATAIRCLTMHRMGVLTEQQALDTFKYSLSMKVKPEEAICHINWDTNNLHGSNELLGKSA